MNNLYISPTGIRWWKLDKWYHRIGGPATECDNGDKIWYENNLEHRKHYPAAEFATWDEWWEHGAISKTTYNEWRR